MNSSSAWLGVVRALALAFAALGALLIAWPRAGSVLFGIETDDTLALAYVRALGFRDIALSLYLLGLSRAASRACRTVLGVSVLIPACDLILVMVERGVSVPGSLLLHAASGVCLAALALWPQGRDRALG
jgi:hypothetical protein